MYSRSSLHSGALDQRPDVAAFAYSAARLPSCMPAVVRVVMGQSDEQFERLGWRVSAWSRVTTRGRRRPLRFSSGVLAAYVTSTSDIDDLVPIVTAYQIEWNKMHRCLYGANVAELVSSDALLAAALGIDSSDLSTLRSAFGSTFDADLQAVSEQECDIVMTLAKGSFAEYQRAAHRWWQGVESRYSESGGEGRPVYFVSSNTHAINNLLGGYAVHHRDQILEFGRQRDPEGLAGEISRLSGRGAVHELANLAFYLLRRYLHDDPAESSARVATVQEWDRQAGITTIDMPGKIDVSAQVIELNKLQPTRIDDRVAVEGVDTLVDSDAVIINIDYPLGMAAYHHLCRLAQGVGDLRGVYVMGKAAILNGRVGDVMISTVAYDEHSQNTYLFRNCFGARDVQPYVRHATVLDNQKALTVRGSFLQNRDYMSVFYREGYTVLEMEAGPFLSAVYELVYPKRHPKDEIVHLSNIVPFELGILHYASDTPYSRRQSLLSKSLSYFGVESTYSCAIAITRAILSAEVKRVRQTDQS